MTWVLILVFNWGASVAVPGYDSKDACEAARSVIGAKIEAVDNKSISAWLTSTCIPGPLATKVNG